MNFSGFNKAILFLLLLVFYQSSCYCQIKQLEPSWQQPEDDLGNVSDEFQEAFFEALKQKAITNYEKAIEALQKCIEIDAEPIVLYYELGKNYLELKEYRKAEENFDKVLKERPEDKHVLELMFETYFKLEKYSESVSIVEKLSEYDPIFKEQLANLYYIEERYEDAIRVIDELTDALGTDAYIQQLRKRISLKIKNPNNQIQRLETKIADNPKAEQNYLNLIYLYSQEGNGEKAYAVAKELLKQKPKSELVHLALYKFYLDDRDIERAITSMNITLQSDVVDEASKYKVIQDFLEYIGTNPQYESRLSEIINSFQDGEGADKIFMELGNFYYGRNEKELALNFYERSLKGAARDYELLKKIVLLQVDLKRYEKARMGSQLAMEMYPAQPIFYLINGVALINLNQIEEAIVVLTSGIDYVIEDQKMEADFYKQIGLAYDKIGDQAKASKYKAKAAEFQNKS